MGPEEETPPWAEADEDLAGGSRDVGAPSSSSSGTGPSPAFTPDAEEAARRLLETLLGLAGLGLHWRLAPGDNPLWLMDDQDNEVIAGSLARIAARHAPQVPGGSETSDLFDGLNAAVGVAGYVIKQHERRAAMAEAYRGATPGGVPGPGAPPVS